jgi:hypothetical protein
MAHDQHVVDHHVVSLSKA